MRPTTTCLSTRCCASISRTNDPAFGIGPASAAGQPGVDQPASPRPTTASTPPSPTRARLIRTIFGLPTGRLPRRSDWCRTGPTLATRQYRIQVTGNLTGTNNWYRTNQLCAERIHLCADQQRFEHRARHGHPRQGRHRPEFRRPLHHSRRQNLRQRHRTQPDHLHLRDRRSG